MSLRLLAGGGGPQTAAGLGAGLRPAGGPAGRLPGGGGPATTRALLSGTSAPLGSPRSGLSFGLFPERVTVGGGAATAGGGPPTGGGAAYAGGAGRAGGAAGGGGPARAGAAGGGGPARAGAAGGGYRRPSGTSAPLGSPTSGLSFGLVGRAPFFVCVGGPCDLTASAKHT